MNNLGSVYGRIEKSLLKMRFDRQPQEPFFFLDMCGDCKTTRALNFLGCFSESHFGGDVELPAIHSSNAKPYEHLVNDGGVGPFLPDRKEVSLCGADFDAWQDDE